MKVLLICILAISSLVLATPAVACTNSQSPCTVGGGVACTQLLYDINFSEACSYWVGSGWTSYLVDNSSGDDYWEIQSWGGSVYQQFTVPTDSDAMDASAVIYLIKNSVGSERISVRLESTSGTLLQSLGTYYASSSGTTITINTATSTFPGQTVRIRFLVSSGSTPGDTLFRVTQAYLRSYNYP